MPVEPSMEHWTSTRDPGEETDAGFAAVPPAPPADAVPDAGAPDAGAPDIGPAGAAAPAADASAPGAAAPATHAFPAGAPTSGASGGHRAAPLPSSGAAPQPRNSAARLAIALAAAGLVLAFLNPALGGLLLLVAPVLGVVGFRRRTPGATRIAVAGLVLGWAPLVLSLAVLTLTMAGVLEPTDEADTEPVADRAEATATERFVDAVRSDLQLSDDEISDRTLAEVGDLICEMRSLGASDDRVDAELRADGLTAREATDVRRAATRELCP